LNFAGRNTRHIVKDGITIIVHSVRQSFQHEMKIFKKALQPKALIIGFVKDALMISKKSLIGG